MPSFSMNISIQEGAMADGLIKPDPQHPGMIQITDADIDEASGEPTIKVETHKLWELKEITPQAAEMLPDLWLMGWPCARS